MQVSTASSKYEFRIFDTYFFGRYSEYRRRYLAISRYQFSIGI